MKYSPETQKQYFQFAYQTGSDIWTHIPYRYKAQEMLPPLFRDALVLDLGAGRGLWAAKLVGLGYRILGIDYIESMVEKMNTRIKEEGWADRGRFIAGDVLDIPFVKSGFEMVTDIGTLQHLEHDDWETYASEVSRVLKPYGYYLNVSLSKRTPQFLGWKPQSSEHGDFEKFGVHYHFFDASEINNLFAKDFTILDQQFESYDSQSDPGDRITLIFTLMQKKETTE